MQQFYDLCCGHCSCKDDCFEYGSCCLSKYESLEDGQQAIESTRYEKDVLIIIILLIIIIITCNIILFGNLQRHCSLRISVHKLSGTIELVQLHLPFSN